MSKQFSRSDLSTALDFAADPAAVRRWAASATREQRQRARYRAEDMASFIGDRGGADSPEYETLTELAQLIGY